MPSERDPTKEDIYDEQINPLMARITEICKKHQINAHATFFLEGEDSILCTTHLKLAGDPLILELLYLAAKCRNNIDLIFITLGRYIHEGRFRDGGSIVMNMLKRGDA